MTSEWRDQLIGNFKNVSARRKPKRLQWRPVSTRSWISTTVLRASSTRRLVSAMAGNLAWKLSHLEFVPCLETHCQSAKWNTWGQMVAVVSAWLWAEEKPYGASVVITWTLRKVPHLCKISYWTFYRSGADHFSAGASEMLHWHARKLQVLRRQERRRCYAYENHVHSVSSFHYGTILNCIQN